MKTNILFLISIFLFAVFFLSSCGKSVYIVKRQFNEGYYVHVSKKVNVSADKSFGCKNNLGSTLVNVNENKAKPLAADILEMYQL